jgi:hypothetical protein
VAALCRRRRRADGEAARASTPRWRRNAGGALALAWRVRKTDADAMKTAITLNACIAGLLATFALACPAAAQRPPAASTAGLEDPQWSVLSDSFGTRMDYPENVFSIDAGPPPRGAGRTLRSADDQAWLMMYVEGNDERHSPASFVRAYFAGQRDSLDYNRVTNRFFAISGVNDEQVFYSRCNFPDGVNGPMHCVYLVYPKNEERRWDAIVTRISRSLRPLD